MNEWTIDRRGFLGAAAGFVATSYTSQFLFGAGVGPTSRRATSGDTVFEPDWQERLTVTVGPEKADIPGFNDKAIQAAVEYVARLRGGIVKILPGTYRLRNAIHLRPGARIVGSGADSVLLKEPSITTKLSEDSDWYDQEITLVDAKGFQVGDGICLQGKDAHTGGPQVGKFTLVARSGNRFKLDRPTRKDFWLKGETTASTLFPIINGEEMADAVIEDVVLDGNRANSAFFDGNYAGGVFLQDCSRVQMRGLEVRNYHGDGISFQICHDIVVERCHVHDNFDLGVHAGSGAQRAVMRDNKIERNKDGVFFCWGVRFGAAEGNVIDDCSRHGVSIGHRDDDNVIRNNRITRSGKVGVFFRPERGLGYQPNRVQVEGNRIADSGEDDGIGIDLQGFATAVDIRGNEIRETRGPAKRIGVRIGADTRQINLADNKIEGFATAVADLRKG